MANTETSGSENINPTPAVDSLSHSQNSANSPSGSRQQQLDSIAGADAEDREDRAFRMLEEGRSATETRKELDAATPEDEVVEPGEQSGEGQNNAGQSQQPQQAGDESPSLDEISRQQLSQAGLLPDESILKQMPKALIDTLLVSAKTIISERTKLYQQQQKTMERNEKGQFKTAEAQKPQTEMDKPEGADGGAVSVGDKLKAIVTRLKENYSDDLAGPIQEALEALAQQNEAYRLEHGKQSEVMKQQTEFLLRNWVAAQEKNARTTLSNEVQNLDDQTFAAIREQAKVLAQAAVSIGQNLSWEDCLMQAGRMFLQPQIRQQEQARLTQKRSNGIKATPSKLGSEAPPPRQMTREQKEDEAYELLRKGKDPREVRAALRPV